MTVTAVTRWQTSDGQETYATEAEAIKADAAEQLSIMLRSSDIFWGTCDPVEVADWLYANFHLTPILGGTAS